MKNYIFGERRLVEFVRLLILIFTTFSNVSGLLAKQPGTPLLSNVYADEVGHITAIPFQVPAGVDTLAVEAAIVDGYADIVATPGAPAKVGNFPAPTYVHEGTFVFTGTTPGTWYLSILAKTSYSGLTIEIKGYAKGDPILEGDVVGRELNVIFPANAFGHVGVYTGKKILEVLDEQPVIQENTLANFKARTPYWGARFLSGNYSYENVIAAGVEQKAYQPKYTLRTKVEVGQATAESILNPATGQYETKTVIKRGKFRCDTFIDYCFIKGINVELVSSLLITPSILFNDLPNSR